MRAPWHLWLIGIIAVLWNAGGAFDYLMTQTNNSSYLSAMTAAQLAWLDARPVWFDAVWAIGVWFAVAGSLLILLRSRFAAPAFLIALAGLIAASVYSFGIARPSSVEVNGMFSVWFTLLICASLIGLWAYARAMALRGVLR